MQDQCSDPKCGCNGFKNDATHAVDLTDICNGLIVYVTPTNSGKFSARGTLNDKWTNSIGIGTNKLDALEKFLSAFNDCSSFVDA